MSTIFAELRRRNVIKMALAYTAVGWLLISIGDVALPLIGAPDWVFKVLILVIALGLPIVVVFAWVFELTPEGLKLERDVDRKASITAETGRKLNYIVIAVLTAALGVSVYLNFAGGPDGPATVAGGDKPSLAVLPFSNRSVEADNSLFVDGIHEDLLTSLAKIAALKVISRNSVMEYRDTTKNLSQVAAELGVATILQGTVQRIGNNVRINVTLIDAESDDYLWADSYDRELTARNIFEIQSEISTQISDALRATLTPSDRDRMDSFPTDNLQAYNLYITARHNLSERRFETAQLARTQFEQAVELDPEYSEAWSGLADSIMLLQINHNAISAEEAYPLAREALQKALELDAGNADAYASLGLLNLQIWEQTRSGPEIDAAEAAFLQALELNPNHARAVMWYASLKGSQNRYDEAVALYQRSLELDPRGRIPYANLPGMYALMGRNQEALDKWLEAVRLHPGWPTPYQNIANHLQGLGRIDEAVAWHTRAIELNTDPMASGNVLGAYLVFGDVARAIDFIDAIPPEHPFYSLAPLFRAFMSGDHRGAVEAMESLLLEGGYPPGFAYDVASDAALLVGDLDAARRYVRLHKPALVEDPIANLDAFNVADVVKLAYIAQREGDAVYAGRLLDAALAYRPRLGQAGFGINDVQILALRGETRRALERLRQAIDAGFRSSLTFDNWTLLEDPYLTSLRSDPRFMEMYEELRIYVSEMRQNALQAESTGDWEVLRARAASVPVNPAANVF